VLGDREAFGRDRRHTKRKRQKKNLPPSRSIVPMKGLNDADAHRTAEGQPEPSRSEKKGTLLKKTNAKTVSIPGALLKKLKDVGSQGRFQRGERMVLDSPRLGECHRRKC